MFTSAISFLRGGCRTFRFDSEGGFGICIIVFGLSTNFWLSVVALFLSGVTDGISVVIRQTILQIYTPDHMRGRVSSGHSLILTTDTTHVVHGGSFNFNLSNLRK